MKNSAKADFLSTRVRYIPLRQIRPNPQQPRRHFEQQSLQELADSINRYGILQPLTVRRYNGGYELIAGERRMRAARLAGLKEVPCLIARVDEEDSALLALIENLQRRDLDYWEEALALEKLIRIYNLTQEQAAEKIGKSQPAVANKIRLLRLGDPVRKIAQENQLTERHARALLRLQEEALQIQAAQTIVRNHWNVAQSEAYIERLLQQQQTISPKRRTAYIVKDVRLFLNSINRGLNMMRTAGVDANWEREDTEGEILLKIRIPKRKNSPVVTEL